ncbi:MAG: 2-succinyl-5-enolpyruvyl-6-hydroxy-3-cyclohexene-1-carboxylate synthase, partial [Actinomycetota bacterium]|nr:2-succinyl-5-enolpyruvyl-6-hydroxy-3-cyclohexene-1-carboxylate synthase [Actinomycetota bacterium]
SVVGAALGRQSSRAVAYVGDLTFVHDANGLVIGPDEPRPDLTIVVANDDGGAIFSTLEQGGTAYAGSFERVFGTPHGVSVRALCEATQTSYERVDDATELRAALAADVQGIRVLEVEVDRRARRALHDHLLALAAE